MLINAMLAKVLRFGFTAVLLLCSGSVVAAEQAGGADFELGKRLVTQVFQYMKDRNTVDIEKITSPAFQSIHQDGAIGKKEEMDLIKNLHLKEYFLDDFKVTRYDNSLVVSYSFTGGEIISGKYVASKSSMRLDCFLKVKDSWQWLAHVNTVLINNSCDY